MQRDVLNMNMEAQLSWIAGTFFGNTLEECSEEEMYYVLQAYCKRLLAVTERTSGEKRIYYVSFEFLPGRLLMNNLINLKIYDRIVALMEKYGKDIKKIEETEPEPGLGSGSLGRLASCFMDSIATEGMPGEGIGLLYHFGNFRQILHAHRQWEIPDVWVERESWLTPTDMSFEVTFGDFAVRANMYDIEAVGYDGCVNKLRLFDLDGVDETLVREGILFDRGKVDKNLTLFLYPDNSDEEGKLLRLYQEYFLSSCAVQWILLEMKEQKYDLRNMEKHAVIQINDTPPALIIPELIRILTAEKAMPMDEAIEVASRVCAFTNHEISPEALERWPMTMLQKVVPHLMPIIRELDRRTRLKNVPPDTFIIRDNGTVSMGAMCVHYGFSVNGPADFYTSIVENTHLKSYKDTYPEKFNNKMDGISFRKWLLESNHPLSNYLSAKISDAYKRDSIQLERLLEFQEDPEVLSELEAIKAGAKRELSDFIFAHSGIKPDPDGVFDIHVKRIHEYKRQSLFALFAIHQYLEIKKGVLPARPINMIIGGKAAPDYQTAKDILHFLLVLQDVIAADPDVSPWLKLIVIGNYNVSYAQKLVPACDICEQLTLASKEASGTTGMKMMLNGGLTLGTRDGVSLEIRDLIGAENLYLFGVDPFHVYAKEASGDYRPQEKAAQSALIRETMDFIVGEEMMRTGDRQTLQRVYDNLLYVDRGMALEDFEDYVRVKMQMLADYEDRAGWMRKSLVSIAKAGYFSSDRTVQEYNRDIWKISVI